MKPELKTRKPKTSDVEGHQEPRPKMKKSKAKISIPDETTNSSGKSRKEARREALSQRLTEKLARMETVAKRHEPKTTENEDQAEKSTKASFWKLRKEKKKRTLFLGSLPGQYDKKQVKDLIEKSVDGAITETIDFVGSQTGAMQRVAKAKAAFVCLTTLDHAQAVQQKLNGMRIFNTVLRCNFSDDKSERAKAIEKRGY